MLREVSKSSRSKGKPEDRVFVKDGLRSFRKTYRPSEVRWGLGTGGVLMGVVGWVGWKGAHPDPELFDMSAALTQPGGSPQAAEPAVERGPLPVGLAQGGFAEGKIGQYSADNLYVKINGRAGFFQSFGVKSLHTITLQAPDRENGEPGPSIDLELYDLGESRNAIGAYNGERQPSITPTLAGGSSFHYDRNAAFLAQGRYYLRLIGSEESPAVRGELERLIALAREKLSGEALPWAYSLFVEELGLPASSVTYLRENAFSFGFASDLFKVSLSPADSDEDMEAFIVAKASAEEAQSMAREFQKGFATLGKKVGTVEEGVAVYEDEFLGSFSGASSHERWVIGVRGAPAREAVAEHLAKLRVGIQGLSPEVRQRAQPVAPPSGESPEAAADPPGAPPGASGSAPGKEAAPASTEPPEGSKEGAYGD